MPQFNCRGLSCKYIICNEGTRLWIHEISYLAEGEVLTHNEVIQWAEEVLKDVSSTDPKFWTIDYRQG